MVNDGASGVDGTIGSVGCIAMRTGMVCGGRNGGEKVGHPQTAGGVATRSCYVWFWRGSICGSCFFSQFVTLLEQDRWVLLGS